MTTDKQQRKATPMVRGLIDYFPDALAAVANVSYVGNQQHNPGTDLHWDRAKSTDHADCLVRHLADRGTADDDGLRHSAKAAWRALALLQVEIEADFPSTASNPSDGDSAIDLDRCGTIDGVTPTPPGDFEYDEAVRLGKITPARHYVGDWNRPDQTLGFWRVTDTGEVLYFHSGGKRVSRFISLDSAKRQIDMGEWVPNRRPQSPEGTT